ncbi:uncharacterized protein si:ch211-174j14.2 [Dunckerocampus dactyliophorus]|uniref:uncharacterized protein si:ch211-174j14.2 n=1 Tax=Dunckerocampus dactyliophorus TaxID=161453 RepID=UPI002404EA4A|nr:uncharacterized protein si:ch211-174j14.2 [Dunckerocampus dactyliophorus]
MASTRQKPESFVWTDDEVELLLRVTLEYKTQKYQENVDWESCQSKYSDIMLAFRQQYATGDMAAGKDFPHDPCNVSKCQVTAKLKAVRNKFRHAVDSGRRRGHGRVVLIFFELCEEIWGGSPATRAIPSGVESLDMLEDDSSTHSPDSPASLDSPHTSISDSLPPGVVSHGRHLLQTKLNNHRKDRLKRKAPMEAAVQEDLQLKRRMIDLMEESERRNNENMRQLNCNIAAITDTLKDSLQLLRNMMQQGQTSVPSPAAQPSGQDGASMYSHMQAPVPHRISAEDREPEPPHIKEEKPEAPLIKEEVPAYPH